MFDVGAIVGGRWVIERPLSSGGMGTVYVAKHGQTGRPVALKVIKVGREVTDELVSRFRKETDALAAVSHPNVVTFLDSGVEADGTLYLVMELLAGKGLRSIMSSVVEPARAYRIAADVCRALAAVHDKGIVHRDLKPENVFLVDAVGHEEMAKLIDFGIARLEDASTRATMTKTGNVVGTPGYISPEQLRGDAATVASDVYAVGVILYELVTGKFPFEAPTTHAMLVKQLIDPLPPPRSIRPELPEYVERDILAFMDRDPSKRVATAKQALALLIDGAARATPPHSHASLPPGAMTEAGTAVAPFQAPLASPVASAATLATPLSVSPSGAGAPKKSGPSFALVAGIGCGGLAALFALVLIVGIVSKNLRDDGRRDRSFRDDALDEVRAEMDAAAREAAQEARDELAGERRERGNNGVARFIGKYDGSYQGSFHLTGAPAPLPNATFAKATVRAGKKSDLVMKVTNSDTNDACEVTLRREGDTAVFDPPQQSCTFVNPDGSRQTNTNSGSAVLQGKDIVMAVQGSFTGAFPNDVSFSGTFTGTWHFTRTK